MSAKHPQSSRPRDRINVKVGPLERTLHTFRDELGQKVALTIATYDAQSVRPLRKRLDWLETPLVVRAWIVTKRWWNTRLVPWFRRSVPPEPPPAA